MTYALDTNIVSYMLKEDADVIVRYRQTFDEDGDFVIPPVVFYEIQRGLLAKNLTKKLAQFNILCQKIEQVEFNSFVWQKAAQIYASLRQQGKLIDDSDIFIAAFCLVNGYTLVTNNTRHFEHINGLKFVNWKL
jgi:predicted nucleic acid-binding protein